MDYDNEQRTLQLRLLDILSEVDRVCWQQGLTYYLVAGTMLGTVRYHVFIPWDDVSEYHEQIMIVSLK